MGRVCAGEKGERKRKESAGRAAGERRERRGWPAGLGPKEKRGRGKKGNKQITRLLNLKVKFEFKRETTRTSMQEHEMHRHMSSPIFIFILKENCLSKIL
jgi:hypothetical protein